MDMYVPALAHAKNSTALSSMGCYLQKAIDAVDGSSTAVVPVGPTRKFSLQTF